MTHYLAFVALTTVLVLVPGPAVILVMQKAALLGVRGALPVAVGILTADLVWAAAASAGVTAVLVASGPAFLALRLAGAAYLVYLGLRLLLTPWVLPTAEPADGTAARGDDRRRASFRQGFLCDMTNPKTVLVFTSVIPQFVPADSSLLLPALFGVTFTVMGFLSLLLYSLVLGRAGRVVRRPRLQRTLLRTSGGLLIGFGAALAVEG